MDLPVSAAVKLIPLTIRGSDRNFFRVKWGFDKTAILINFDPNRSENNYYADIAIFLDSIHVPVPRVISHDPAECLMIFEDMGDTDLWSLKDSPGEVRLDFYRKTLSIAYRLHSFPENQFPREKVRIMDSFDQNLYYWEQEYFKEHFVENVCGINIRTSLMKEIKTELSNLVCRLLQSGNSLIHRDLQSRNVMIFNEKPFLIDFQGMRFGNPLYDVASLLCDPYVHFSEEEIDCLLSYYYGLSDKELDWDSYKNVFLDASVQRLMQALGAYGFLGLKKGIKEFLEYIPPGLAKLQHAVFNTKKMTGLCELILSCCKAVERKE